jgi:hypothetical protein
MWAKVKGIMAEWNTTFITANVEWLIYNEIYSISISACANCVWHAEELQQDFWKDTVKDVLEPILISFQASEDESGTDFSTNLE